MARRQTLKYLLREELASKKEAGYGRSKHNDKLKTEQEREKLTTSLLIELEAVLDNGTNNTRT